MSGRSGDVSCGSDGKSIQKVSSCTNCRRSSRNVNHQHFEMGGGTGLSDTVKDPQCYVEAYVSIIQMGYIAEVL